MNITQLLNEYYGTESNTVNEFLEDIKEDDITIPFHVAKFLQFVEKRVENTR